MATIFFDGLECPAAPDETLLQTLLRHQISVPSGCRVGACQACLLQITAGIIPPVAQLGLTQEQKNAGCVLSCVCKPQGDINAQVTQLSAPLVSARVVGKEMLSATILRLQLSKPFEFNAGQYVRLAPPGGFGRCYSIASLARDNVLEFHIKIIPGGEFSQWVHQQLQVGDELQVQGPLGNCCYQASSLDQPLFLAAIGTGAAALSGVLRSALAARHRGPIHWLQGAKNEQGLYSLPGLNKVAAAPNVHLHFIVQEPGVHSDTYVAQDIYRYSKQLIPNFKGQQVYLGGAESFVRKMKKQCFLAGANLSDIFADAFVASAVAKVAE